MYATPYDKIITTMLHHPQTRTNSFWSFYVHSVKEQTAEYDIDNRSVYDILIRSVMIVICIFT